MSQNYKNFLIALPITLLIIIVAFLGYNGYKYSKLKDTTKEVAGETDEIKIGLSSDIVGLYPDVDPDLPTINTNSSFFEGLVGFDENFRVKSLLAESWNNPDDLTWRIYLKKNVKFHNGEILKASDVKFTYDLLKEKDLPLSDYLSHVEQTKVLDDTTIEIKTKDPYPILMNKLMGAFILSEKSYKADGGKTPVGTGPYKFVSWEKGQNLKVERFDGYHGDKPMAKKITFVFAEDEDQLAEKITKGEADIAAFYSSADAVKKVKDNKNLDIKTNDDYGVTFLMPNLSAGTAETNLKTNPFLDPKVRQAIYYCLDIDKYIDSVAKETAAPASQLTTPSIFGYNSKVKRYPYDPEKAKALLKEAGYENGFDAKLVAHKGRTKDVEEIVSQLGKIGIKITPDLGETPKEMFGKLTGGKFSLTIANWANDSGDSSDLIDSLLKTDGESNFSGFTNKDIDGLSTKASSTMDQKKRKDYLNEALKIVNDDADLIPLVVQRYFYAANKTISFEPRADTVIKAENLAIKKTETIKKPSFLTYTLGLIGL